MTSKIMIGFLFFTVTAFAALDENIFIQGKIGNEAEHTRVKVIDSHGQKYWLPKSVFPKKFKFEEGAIFNIEVSEAVIDEAFSKVKKK